VVLEQSFFIILGYIAEIFQLLRSITILGTVLVSESPVE